MTRTSSAEVRKPELVGRGNRSLRLQAEVVHLPTLIYSRLCTSLSACQRGQQISLAESLERPRQHCSMPGCQLD